jgi:hypothetical protein
MKHDGFAAAGREPPKVDRRTQARLPAHGAGALMRPGQRLIVIDVSASGALVEGGRPLRPGSDIEVQLEGDARGGMVAAHVTRCAVAALHGESGITYRAALAFNEACDWVREILTRKGYRMHGEQSIDAAAGTNRGTVYPHPSKTTGTTENGELND